MAAARAFERCRSVDIIAERSGSRCDPVRTFRLL